MSSTYLFMLPFHYLLNLIFSKCFLIFFMIHTIFSYLLLKYVMKRTKKYIETKQSEEHIHTKYEMFRRLDAKHWNENLFLLGAIFVSGFKVTGVILGITLCYLRLKILMWNKDINDSNIRTDPILRKKIESIVNFSSRLITLSFGIIVTKKKIDYDYSAYLGPNYVKGDKDTPISTYISNHTSWLDTFLLIDDVTPGFIAKSDVKSYPMIGFVATCMGSIFVDRSDKANRGDIIKLLAERQTSIHKKEDLSQLLIFPEGTTSNNSGIINFKQGAFLTKLNVKPYIIKCDPINNLSLTMDVIEMLLHVYIVLCKPIHYVTVISLPVFVPNEYLFKHSKHANGDMEWKVYAEAMREIMCDASGLVRHDASYEMKVEYLNFFRNPNHKGKKGL